MKLFGISPLYNKKTLPKNDATIKYKYGMPTNGDPKFTNQFGINGVNLKNIMYQNKLFSLAFIIELNLLNKAGNLLNTSYFAKV